jgi:hypothetical protein
MPFRGPPLAECRSGRPSDSYSSPPRFKCMSFALQQTAALTPLRHSSVLDVCNRGQVLCRTCVVFRKASRSFVAQAAPAQLPSPHVKDPFRSFKSCHVSLPAQVFDRFAGTFIKRIPGHRTSTPGLDRGFHVGVDFGLVELPAEPPAGPHVSEDGLRPDNEPPLPIARRGRSAAPTTPINARLAAVKESDSRRHGLRRMDSRIRPDDTVPQPALHFPNAAQRFREVDSAEHNGVIFSCLPAFPEHGPDS